MTDGWFKKLYDNLRFSNPRQAANTLTNLAERRLGRRRLFSFPPVVQVEVTNRCNLNCFMCSRATSPFRGRDLDPDLLPAVVGISRFSHELVLFGYGEPLVAQAFFELLGSAKSACVSFVTNGVALDKRLLDHILSTARRPLGTVAFSIDAAEARVYRSIRRGAEFERVWTHLLGVLAAEGTGGRKRPEVWIDFVAMKTNVAQLPLLVGMAADAGVDRVNVLNVVVWDDRFKEESLFFNPDAARAAFAAAERVAAEKAALRPAFRLDLPVVLDRSRQTDALVDCFEPWRYTYIRQDGTVQACCFTDDLAMGNLRGRPFFEIWNSNEYQRLRAAVNSKAPPGVCLRCELRFRKVNSVYNEGVYLKLQPRAFVGGK